MFTDNNNLIDQVIDCDASFDGSWQKGGTRQRMVLYQLYQETMENS